MIKHITILLLALFTLSCQTGNLKTVDTVLQMQTPPTGVVFDIDEWDHDALTWAIPAIQKDIKRLRKQFPDIKLAVVSHGEEEFALMMRSKGIFPNVHKNVKKLIDDDVKVFVCAGHALMNGQSETSFVDFIETVPAGADKVAQYMRSGYIYLPVIKAQP